MQNKFGKKLEEARTRRGISIRQASDDLKIRPDFLLSFENDNGSFSMPKVYKTGFIKLYARYLKLDSNEIANDFNAYYDFDNNKSKDKEEREHLGRIELITPEAIQPIQAKLNLAKDIEEEEDNEDFTFKKTTYPSTQSLYMKMGFLFSGGIVGLIAIAFAINNWVSSTNSPANSITAYEKQLAAQAKNAIEQLILSGEDSIHVVVRQENDKQRLFSGNIDKTHPITVTRQGPVKIHFSDGSKLTIEKPDGKKINPGRQGKGWIEL